ncbi:hypothetical protein F5887DRAFT_454310 [Amanita rubescens]|nr:hypothetical protein F5887DRAFT_454310 [Amanita rubescens]
MGQSNSRYQPPQSPDNFIDDDHHLPTTSRTTQPLTQSTAEGRPSYVASSLDTPASSRLSHRSVLRRNFLGFTKSPSQSSSREGSLASSSSNRRSWLNPRRWSRAPSSLAEAADDHPYQMDGPSIAPPNAKGKEKEDSGARDFQSQLSTDQQSPDSNPSLSPQIVTPSSTSDNISEPAPGFSPVDEPSRLPSPMTSITGRDDDSRSQPTPVVAQTPIADKQAPPPPPEPPTTDGNVETFENESSATTAIGTGLTTDSTTSRSSESPGSNASTTAAAAAPAAATTRPFPPPGTLVVVQGVVHTTDVPRSNVGSSDDAASVDNNGTQSSRSPSQEQNGASTRSRLSTLLRPRSAGPAFGMHHSGLLDDAAQISQQTDGANPIMDETNGTAENATYTSQESGDFSSSPSTATDDPTAMGNESSRITPAGSQHSEGRQDVILGEGEQDGATERNSDDVNESGPISSSSIDVLGTLLRCVILLFPLRTPC